MKFTNGMKVKVKSSGNDSTVGLIGTVVDDEDQKMPGIEFSQEIYGGHDCNCKCEVGYGWYVFAEDLVIIPEFKVGDRVMLNKSFLGIPAGTTGTVVDVEGLISVQFDEKPEITNFFITGHDCGGKSKEGYGLYIASEDLLKTNYQGGE